MPMISMTAKPTTALKMMPSEPEPKVSIISRTSGGTSFPAFSMNSIMRRWSGAVTILIGTDTAT